MCTINFSSSKAVLVHRFVQESFVKKTRSAFHLSLVSCLTALQENCRFCNLTVLAKLTWGSSPKRVCFLFWRLSSVDVSYAEGRPFTIFTAQVTSCFYFLLHCHEDWRFLYFWRSYKVEVPCYPQRPRGKKGNLEISVFVYIP